MRPNDQTHWGERFLPKWKGVQWTWKRCLLLALSVFPFADQFFVPLSRWDDRRGEGMLFLILAFRAVARAEPTPSTLIASVGLIILGSATSHDLISEVSLVWTPVELGLLLFILLWWHRGNRDLDSGAN